MKILIRILLAIVLISTGLAVGLAIGYPVGRYYGFETGSEWALMQADLIAREAGVFIPVYYSEEHFHVILKQPPGVYREARRFAEFQGATELLDKEKKTENVRTLLEFAFLKQ